VYVNFMLFKRLYQIATIAAVDHCFNISRKNENYV